MNPIVKPTSIMLYGQSSSTKTTQLYFLAKWLWETKRLRTRLISSDPGGYAPFIDSGYIEQGIVDVFDYTNRELALADIRRLSKGYWPVLAKDETGKVFQWFQTDERCLTTPETWAGIGMVAIDSMYHTAETLKSHCAQRPGNAIGGGKDGGAPWEFTEDGETVRGTGQSVYGTVQEEILRRHREGFSNLPVKFLVWTSLIGTGGDRAYGEKKDLSREKIYGPQMVGTATTHAVPSWFYHCLHLDTAILPKTVIQNGQHTIVKNDKGEPITEQKKVAWFQDHFDPEGIRYLCKTRLLPEKIPTLLQYFPFGCVPLSYTSGIEKYFKVLEKLSERK